MSAECGTPRINAQLLLFIENKLTPEQTSAVAEHLLTCDSCSQELQALEDIHSILLQNRSIFEKPAISRECLPAELLVAYADRTKPLSASTRQSIENHLSGCSNCKSILAVLETLHKSSVPAAQTALGEDSFLSMVSRNVPLRRTHRRSALSRFRSAASIRMNLLSDRIICALNPSYQPSAVRAKKRSVSENVTVIQDGTSRLNVRIEIEDVDGGCAEIVVLIKRPPRNEPLQDIRASLFSDGKETVSLYVTDGRAVFCEVPHGLYELIITKGDQTFKTVQFTTLADKT